MQISGIKAYSLVYIKVSKNSKNNGLSCYDMIFALNTMVFLTFDSND